MLTKSFSRAAPAIGFDHPNWISSDPLPRDRTQSRRLHEPEHRISNIDPITGEDITDVKSHPYLEDGDLTIYFQSEDTRRAYLEMPVNHPMPRLPFPGSDDDDRGG